MIPTKVFLTKGVGRDKYKLQSFELALRDAGIQHCNLVMVSSIYPPACELVPRKAGLEYLDPGEIVHCVMSRNESNEPNRLMSASVGLAIPNDKTKYGYLSEHHDFGHNEAEASDIAEDLAASMLASTLGIEFDPGASWDEREEQFKISGEIVKTTNITQSAICDKNGRWTSVLAAAVFIFPENEERLSKRRATEPPPAQMLLHPAQDLPNNRNSKHDASQQPAAASSQ